MATLHSLPQELLYRILELGAASVEAYPERVAFLLSSSLVSSSWRADAQALLWKRVEIRSWDAAIAFLASGRKGRTTESLVVRGPQNESLMGEIVDACEGLKELSIGIARLRGDLMLRSSNLRDLTSLTLDRVSFQMIETTSIPFPFHLTDLSLDLRSHLPPPDSLAHLLGPSLHSLSLTFFQPVLTPSHLVPLLDIGPHLTSLSLLHVDGSTCAPFLPFIATCSRLSHLSNHPRSAFTTLPLLPSKIEEWTVLGNYSDLEVSTLLDLLRADVPALARLRRLRVCSPETYFGKNRFGAEVLRVCEGRKIEVEYVSRVGKR